MSHWLQDKVRQDQRNEQDRIYTLCYSFKDSDGKDRSGKSSFPNWIEALEATKNILTLSQDAVVLIKIDHKDDHKQLSKDLHRMQMVETIISLEINDRLQK